MVVAYDLIERSSSSDKNHKEKVSMTKNWQFQLVLLGATAENNGAYCTAIFSPNELRRNMKACTEYRVLILGWTV